MTSFFLTKKIVRSKSQQWTIYRIKFQHIEWGHTIRLEKYQAYT